mgnify:CR=1 FL=1
MTGITLGSDKELRVKIKLDTMIQIPDLFEELIKDEPIAEADTLMLTVPNQLGLDYNTHITEAILTQVAPALSWR